MTKLDHDRFYALREPNRKSKVVIDGWDCVVTTWDIGEVRVAWRHGNTAVFCVGDGSLSCAPDVPGTVVAWLVEPLTPAPSIAPVTGDRLLASLACHIDHDEPPGLAARELATELLGLLDGLSSFQVVMLSAHVRELAAKFKPGQPGEGTSA